jgi:hypothetical protein
MKKVVVFCIAKLLKMYNYTEMTHIYTNWENGTNREPMGTK